MSRAIGSQIIERSRLQANSGLYPVRIRAGALGEALPSQDLLVSQQHRILISSKIAERMFDQREVLIAAKHLIGLPGIEIDTTVSEVEYWHFLFEEHEIVFSNDVKTESLYTGPQALKSVSPEAREEIFAIFPQLRDLDPVTLPSAARFLVPGRKARKFAQRALAKGENLWAGQQ